MSYLEVPETQPILENGTYNVCCVGLCIFGTIVTEFKGVQNDPALHGVWHLEFKDQEWERLGVKTPWIKEHRPFEGWNIYFQKAGAERQSPYWQALTKWEGKALDDDARRAHNPNDIWGKYGVATLDTEFPAGKDPYNKVLSIAPHKGKEWAPKTQPWRFDIKDHKTLKSATEALEGIPSSRQARKNVVGVYRA